MNAAVRGRSAPASSSRAHSEPQGLERPSPEHCSSASSGTYFRAVRPTPAEPATLAGGEPVVVDGTKVERLRSLVVAGLWRADGELIAVRMLADAG